MTITYVTNINQVTCYPTEPQPNCVFQVSWVVSGTDGTYNAASYGSTDVPYVAADPYIPYDQLTQDIVVNWVNDYSADAITTAQASVDAAIALNYNTNDPIAPPLPWNTPAA